MDRVDGMMDKRQEEINKVLYMLQNSHHMTRERLAEESENMKLELRMLKGFPEKKEDMTRCIGGGETRTQKAVGFNAAREEIGSMSVGLDGERIKHILVDLVNGGYGEIEDMLYKDIEKIAKAIADNIKSILVVKGEKK